MNLEALYSHALDDQPLSPEQGLTLYQYAPTPVLIHIAHQLRCRRTSSSMVTWQIDRNVNITNVCISGCKFCNFHCGANSQRAFVTTMEQYRQKIDELLSYGGNQLLLQGGLHPKLGLKFYCDLFQQLKAYCPNLTLHALGPPEIAHIARLERCSHRQVLETLIKAGLDSLPGAGAEILVPEIRQQISPAKPCVEEWIEVMRVAHQFNMLTSATMMVGHIETPAHRIEHLHRLRQLQAQRPANAIGFMNFALWTFQGQGTALAKHPNYRPMQAEEYIRTVAISRIMLHNINNIQASWLTVGRQTAQICLHAGANDLGSIMIEENVVSSAGAQHRMDAFAIQQTIAEAGFAPQLRNQRYQPIELPPCPNSRIYARHELRLRAATPIMP